MRVDIGTPTAVFLFRLTKSLETIIKGRGPDCSEPDVTNMADCSELDCFGGSYIYIPPQTTSIRRTHLACPCSLPQAGRHPRRPIQAVQSSAQGAVTRGPTG